MNDTLKQYEKAFIAKGETPERALIMAHDKNITEGFRKLHTEIVSVKRILAANYGEVALKNMNDNE